MVPANILPEQKPVSEIHFRSATFVLSMRLLSQRPINIKPRQKRVGLSFFLSKWKRHISKHTPPLSFTFSNFQCPEGNVNYRKYTKMKQCATRSLNNRQLFSSERRWNKKYSHIIGTLRLDIPKKQIKDRCQENVLITFDCDRHIKLQERLEWKADYTKFKSNNG